MIVINYLELLITLNHLRNLLTLRFLFIARANITNKIAEKYSVSSQTSGEKCMRNISLISNKGKNKPVKQLQFYPNQ